jgi:hypothetical protein
MLEKVVVEEVDIFREMNDWNSLQYDRTVVVLVAVAAKTQVAAEAAEVDPTFYASNDQVSVSCNTSNKRFPLSIEPEAIFKCYVSMIQYLTSTSML